MCPVHVQENSVTTFIEQRRRAAKSFRTVDKDNQRNIFECHSFIQHTVHACDVAVGCLSVAMAKMKAWCCFVTHHDKLERVTGFTDIFRSSGVVSFVLYFVMDTVPKLFLLSFQKVRNVTTYRMANL